ncbi:MAG TPA: HAMP domain-containing sensor histidine kinase, partial [Ktedonobacterales bacterium]
EPSLRRLGRLVDDVLDESRIQSGRLEFRMVSCDLSGIVRAAVEEQRQLASARTIHRELPDAQPTLVLADASRIEQVVTNYLTNALKYSREDRPVAVRLQVDGETARVSVRDEGVGVPLAEQAHVWERFHPIEGIAVQSGSGVSVGIGLYISKSIIERHQGQVGVRSAPGQGSTFWFTQPLAQEAQKALAEAPGHEPGPAG